MKKYLLYAVIAITWSICHAANVSADCTQPYVMEDITVHEGGHIDCHCTNVTAGDFGDGSESPEGEELEDLASGYDHDHNTIPNPSPPPVVIDDWIWSCAKATMHSDSLALTCLPPMQSETHCALGPEADYEIRTWACKFVPDAETPCTGPGSCEYTSQEMSAFSRIAAPGCSS